MSKLTKDKVQLECGATFCELCGDCMYCYGDDPCYGDIDSNGEPGYHWYSDEEETE